MDDILKNIENDGDGMVTYEYICNHCDDCCGEMDRLVANLQRVDRTGQFLASSARFLAAVDREKYSPWLPALIEGAIAKDRERRYIGSLLEAIWGADYLERAEELRITDDNFRRIFKRVYPEQSPETRNML